MKDITFSSEIPMVPELGYQFSIRLKDPYSNTEVIFCKEIGLEIEVDINPSKSIKPGELTLVMQWEKDCAYFTIVERENTPRTLSIFEDAIWWYVVKHIQKQPAKFNWSSRVLQTYWIDEEDGFEQVETWSEEESKWQQHISDEQRNYEIADKLAKMAGR